MFSPSGGTYGPNLTVTLGGPSGATIRYTTDGTEPEASSAAYTGPLTLTASSTIKAASFQSGWTPSATSAASYSIDSTAPVIRARVSPPPNAAGWNNSPVTVSFSCTDASPVPTCPGPVGVSADGAGQVVNATATDAFGNSGSIQLTVNIDSVPPVVSLTAPLSPVTTAAASVTVTGTASDAGAGLAAVLCEGSPGTLAGGGFECIVPLRFGRQQLMVTAVDAAGSSRAQSLTVSRTGSITALVPTTAKLILAPGSERVVAIHSDLGLPVSNLTWSSSAPSTVQTAPANDGTIRALAMGTATVTATDGVLSAEISVTVLGGAPGPGEVLWAGAPLAVSGTWPVIVPASPVKDEDPDLFEVATRPLDSATVVAARRAVDGDVLWTQVFSSALSGVPWGDDAPPIPNLRGGLLAKRLVGDPYASPLPTHALRQIGGDGTAAWEYVSGGWIRAYAPSPNGTVVLAEHLVTGVLPPPYSDYYTSASFIVGLDGEDGHLLFRRPLPVSTNTYPLGGCTEPLIREEGGLEFGEFTVLDDGDVAFQFLESHYQWLPHVVAANPFPECVPGAGQVSVSRTLRQYRVDAQGSMVAEVLGTHAQTLSDEPGLYDGPWFSPLDTTTDGRGGMLSIWWRMGLDANGGYLSERLVGRVSDSGVNYTADMADASIAMVTSDGRAYVADGTTGQMMVRNTLDWSLQWQTSGWALPIEGLDGGGVRMVAWDENFTPSIQDADDAGTVLSAAPGDAMTVVLRDQGLLHGVSSDGAVQMVAIEGQRRSSIWSAILNGLFGRTRSECTPGRLYADTGGPHTGLVPNATYTFDFANFPSGDDRAFLAQQRSGVELAFSQWNLSSDSEALTRTFRSRTEQERLDNVPPTLTIRKQDLEFDGGGDPIIGALLPPNGHPSGTRITEAVLWLTSDDQYLLGEIGYFKATLHEAGHSLGLAHPERFQRGGTVMNRWGIEKNSPFPERRRDDVLRNIALWPTACDIRAVRASEQP